MKNFYKRLAAAEAEANALKAERIETLQQAYKKACASRNEEEAATLARAIRNKLLDVSDKEMSIDRLGLNTGTATKLVASLVSIFNGAWAVYRQQLRELPEQEGFPFDIEFPTPPDEAEAE